MTEYRFLDPVDVLYLRGNRLFDGAGAWSPAQMPPWPSIVAGALRSRMLADSGIDFGAFAQGRIDGMSAEMAASLGTPTNPGNFRIQWFGLARRVGRNVEALLPLPSDLVVTDQPATSSRPVVTALHPCALHPAISASLELECAPLLTSPTPTKPIPGYWLSQNGINSWAQGGTIDAQRDLVHQAQLWATDTRLGIALDSNLRSAADGMIYTSDTIATSADIGFLVGIDGAEGLLPESGLLRFGGDGRAAHLGRVKPDLPEPDWQRIAKEQRLRIMLTTPGLFDDGWRLPGTIREGNHWVWKAAGIRAHLTCAVVGRADTISGWDLARGRPKPALRVAPIGSVYWLDRLEGDVSGLRQLLDEGLWPLVSNPDRSRQVEGFNRVLLAPWARADRKSGSS